MKKNIIIVYGIATINVFILKCSLCVLLIGCLLKFGHACIEDEDKMTDVVNTKMPG